MLKNVHHEKNDRDLKNNLNLEKHDSKNFQSSPEHKDIKEQKEGIEGKVDFTIKKKEKKTQHEIDRQFRDIMFYFSNLLLTYVATAIIFSKPNIYYVFNALVTTLFYIHRINEFIYYKWHFYLIDFCYFVNFFIIIFSYFYQDNFQFFISCFGSAMGFVLYGTYYYRSAMVYHNTVKMTSVWAHLSPAITIFLFRWYNNKIKHQTNLFLFGHNNDLEQSLFKVITESENCEKSLFNFTCSINFIKNFLISLDIWNLSQINFSCYLFYFKNILYIYIPWVIFYYILNFQIFYDDILNKKYENQFMLFYNKKDKRFRNFGKTGLGYTYMIYHFLFIFYTSSFSFLFLYSYHLGVFAIIVALFSTMFNASTYYIKYFSKEYSKQFDVDNINQRITPI